MALLLLSVWSVLLPVSLPISTVAAVTARLASVPSPIRGEAIALTRDTGDRIGVGEALADISNRRAPADERVVELEAERAALDARLAALRDEVTETGLLLAGYKARSRALQERVLSEREALLLESERAYDVLVVAAELAETRRTRLEARAAGGEAVDSLELADARREATYATKAVVAEGARIERLRGHVEGARTGIVGELGLDGSVPRYPALVEETEARLARLGVELRHAERLRENLEQELRGAVARLNRSIERRVASPVSGVVWSRAVDVGRFVESGAELYRIADHRTLRVQAYLHRRYLDDVAVGDHARVYLVASRQVVGATVRVIQAIDGSAAKDDSAVDLPLPDDDHFQILLELDEAGRKAAEIGGVAKVAVVGAPDGWFERALLWLYLRFES